jgi:hypothetical protein
MQRLRDEAEVRTRSRSKAAGAAAGAGSAAKEPKPLVKIPKNKVGRAVFFGSQAAGAVTATRAIKNARAKGDKLELVHGVLTAALLAATALLALRNTRHGHSAADGDGDGQPAELISGR